MILSKKFDCTTEDLDSVIVAVAKEIEDGWHVTKIETNPIMVHYGVRRDEPDFSIELCRKDTY